MRQNAQSNIDRLLKEVSRSFYLTLRILPRSIRPQISLAYLLARATDTIADTETLPAAERIKALRGLRRTILELDQKPLELPDLQPKHAGERLLLARLDDAVKLLFLQEPGDRALIQSVLQIITEGQELDLIRFGSLDKSTVVALETDDELDDYAYRVAGCVGEFWTKICVQHLSPKPRLAIEPLLEKAVRFGKGLQLVNILRDLPLDLQKGRCYLPRLALEKVGLSPSDLLDKSSEKKLRRLYNQWLATAEDHLKIGWSYVLDLPFSWYRVRLACAWPVLIGLKTAAKLETSPIIDPEIRIKVSRAEIKSLMAKSITTCLLPKAWGRLPESILRR